VAIKIVVVCREWLKDHIPHLAESPRAPPNLRKLIRIPTPHFYSSFKWEFQVSTVRQGHHVTATDRQISAQKNSSLCFGELTPSGASYFGFFNVSTVKRQKIAKINNSWLQKKKINVHRQKIPKINQKQQKIETCKSDISLNFGDFLLLLFKNPIHAISSF